MIITKNKKILLFAATAAVSVLSLFYIFSTPNSQNNQTSSALPTPPIKRPFSGSYLIESSLSKNEVKLPAKLTVYKLTNSPMSPTELNLVSTRLEFNTQPTILKDANYGDVYLWFTPEKSLRIIPNDFLYDYGRTIEDDTTTPFPSESELITIANDFLKNNFLQNNMAAAYDSISYINITSEGYKIVPIQQAGLADIKFIQKINDYDIVNETVEIGTINVRVARDGTIASLYADLVNVDTGAENTEAAILTFEELESSLSEARLQSLDNGNIEVITLHPGSVSKIIVESAKISYFKTSVKESIFLQPIFVLTGRAIMVGGETVPALLHLPAVKN